MPINCPRLGCPGVVPDDQSACPVCQLNVTPKDRELAARIGATPRPGSAAWFFGGDGIKFAFQLVALLFLVAALVAIVVLFFRSNDGRVDLSNFTTTQGLIAGVLLAAISAAVVVSVMTILFSGGPETLRDRGQLVRDVLAPILVIFSTVTGFYFGAKTVEDQGGGRDKSLKAGDGKEKTNTAATDPPGKKQ